MTTLMVYEHSKALSDAATSIAGSLERISKHTPPSDRGYEEELRVMRQKHIEDHRNKNHLISQLQLQAKDYEATRNEFIKAREEFAAEAKKNEEDLATARLLGPALREKELKDDAVARIMWEEIRALAALMVLNKQPALVDKLMTLSDHLSRWIVEEDKGEPEETLSNGLPEKHVPPTEEESVFFNRSQAMDVAPKPPIMSDDQVAKMLEASRHRPKCVDLKCPVTAYTHSHATEDGQWDEKMRPAGESGSLTSIGPKE